MSHITELTVEECLSLLTTKQVGRIGLTTPAGPQILPVNYTVHDEKIVFRTLPYGVIANNAHEARVAFEVDDLDDVAATGWSVLAVGRCARIEDPGEVHLIRDEADPEPWAEGHRILYFRVDWDDLTGRQVGGATRPTLVPSGRSTS